MTARILLFALEELRVRHGASPPRGTDPRHDTSPFRAFRASLLEAIAVAARAPCQLLMWWEGTYNGYALAVGAEPAEALAEFDPATVCPIDAERVALPPASRYPLARIAPGRAEVVLDEEGGCWEAPFGAPTGHFGAPGMRRIL